MELLSIGQFATASRLSAKALRLYDELGLLAPVYVDPATGYRFYAVQQLDRARMVLWLRRIGMPLAQIRVVCDMPPAEAAAQIAQFWEQAEAETASRRDLVAFLVDLLSERDASVDGVGPVLRMRYASGCDVGLVRASNQDAGHAGPRLLAVADGFAPGGDAASAAAIDALLAATDEPVSSGGVLNLLADAAQAAGRAIAALPPSSLPQAGASVTTGTTLTAMVLNGSRLALVHIGDSRAYMLRAGELFQITHDHSVVQALVDEGRLTREEATSHPQRAMLLRCLDGRSTTGLDMGWHQAQVGDRYLLCSDGAWAVIPDEEIRRVLVAATDPQAAVGDLMGLVHKAGAPDNVALVVADIDSCDP